MCCWSAEEKGRLDHLIVLEEVTREEGGGRVRKEGKRESQGVDVFKQWSSLADLFFPFRR